MIKLNRNNTNFPIELLNLLKKIPNNSKYDFLKYYQKLTQWYVTNVEIDSRGILINHTMGAGKSMLAISIVMELMREYSVIFLQSKSLEQNIKKSIKKYIKMRTESEPDYYLGKLTENLDKWIDANFSFISMNSSNMMKKMAESTDELFDKKLKKLVDLPSLNGKIIVIDEAHELFRAITNGSKNAVALYDSIMKCNNVKLLFLTGTAMSNDPFELVPCFNMLGSKKPNNPIFPESYKNFNENFIKNDKINNKDIFQDRIFGLVSRITQTTIPGAILGNTEPISSNYPITLVPILEKVKMTDIQLTEYNKARQKELKEKGYKATGEIQRITKPKSGQISTYRVKSRQYCNVVGESSAKFDKMIENIEKSDGNSLVYSQFINMGGLAAFVEFLKKKNWREYDAKNGGIEEYINIANSIGGETPKNKNTDLEMYVYDNFMTGGANIKSFAVITGEIDVEKRQAIIDVFNSDENKYGDIIKTLLVSSTGALGLDLKNIRTVHIMEPYWVYSRLRQIESRAARNDSHISLKPEERTVQMYIYLSTKEGETTTDEEIYEESLNKQFLLDSFQEAIDEVSIECSINADENCRTCALTSEVLYTNNLEYDINRGSPCNKIIEKQINAKEIIVNGEKYYYSENSNSVYDYNIFEFDKLLNGYIKMNESNELFSKIIDTLEEKLKK